jgi:hypothetical protein
MVVSEFWDLTGRKDGLERWPGAGTGTGREHFDLSPTHIFSFSFLLISFSVRTEQKAIPAKEGVRKNEAAKKNGRKKPTGHKHLRLL